MIYQTLEFKMDNSREKNCQQKTNNKNEHPVKISTSYFFVNKKEII